MLDCIECYHPDSVNLFSTYAASAVRNAMIDCIRSQRVSFESKNLNGIISLDEPVKGEVRSKHHFIADPTSKHRNKSIWRRNVLRTFTTLCI